MGERLKQQEKGSGSIVEESADIDLFQEMGLGATNIPLFYQPFVEHVPEFSVIPSMNSYNLTEDVSLTEDLTWSVIEVGVQEPLPPLEAMDEL
jgi:hypothetical protein